MKIGWIAPLHKKCGIAFYAKAYAQELANYTDVILFDPLDFIQQRKHFISTLNKCDIIHIQYEVSLFSGLLTNYYSRMCRELSVKKVISFHEIFDDFPGIFQRRDIKGHGILKKLKETLWDIRHVHGASYLKHCRHNFYGNTFIVHAQFQKEILINKGIKPEHTIVIPMPVPVFNNITYQDINQNLHVTLGATGFINPAFDYDLLFSVLDKLAGDWQFIWIGGIRRKDDKKLLDHIQHQIDIRSWRNKFIITGWISQQEHTKQLMALDIFCAFFKQRSSSESLSDAIAAQRLIIATRIPLTEELVSKAPVCILVEPNQNDIVSKIQELCSDEALQKMLRNATKAYTNTYSYNRCAKRLTNLYESILTS